MAGGTGEALLTEGEAASYQLKRWRLVARPRTVDTGVAPGQQPESCVRFRDAPARWTRKIHEEQLSKEIVEIIVRGRH